MNWKLTLSIFFLGGAMIVFLLLLYFGRLEKAVGAFWMLCLVSLMFAIKRLDEIEEKIEKMVKKE